jgi:phage N-6-adenine-methyltransferase
MKTEKELRQEWRTPNDLFEMLDHEVGGFNVDVAADVHNTKCYGMISEEMDALSMLEPWFGRHLYNTNELITSTKVWCNPPYADPAPWISRAFMETYSNPGTVVYMLLNHDASTKWYKTATQQCAEIRIMTGGRVKFTPADKSITDNKAPNKGQCLLVFRHTPAPCHVWHWDWKHDLEMFQAGQNDD